MEAAESPASVLHLFMTVHTSGMMSANLPSEHDLWSVIPKCMPVSSQCIICYINPALQCIAYLCHAKHTSPVVKYWHTTQCWLSTKVVGRLFLVEGVYCWLERDVPTFTAAALAVSIWRSTSRLQKGSGKEGQPTFNCLLLQFGVVAQGVQDLADLMHQVENRPASHILQVRLCFHCTASFPLSHSIYLLA